MAYSTSNPPVLVAGPLTGAGRKWVYRSTDAPATVRVANYITNGKALGMQAGDLVEVYDTDASPITCSLMVVQSVGTSGADLSDGTAVTVTNTD